MEDQRLDGRIDGRLAERITDALEEGVIYLDASKQIRLFNRKAREITGLVSEQTGSHPAASIAEGDIVILADNDLGNDDGGLAPQDLERINIKDPDLRQGDVLLAAGVYGNPAIPPTYKHFRGSRHSQTYSLKERYLGFDLEISIQNQKLHRSMDITVNGAVYHLSFLDSVGHLVILDGRNGQVKFFQAKGYTIRQEALNAILHGKPFLAKGGTGNDLNVIGMPIDQVFEAGPLTEAIDQLLAGETSQLIGADFQINKRLTICSLFAIKNVSFEIEGVLLTVRDASELDRLLDDRNQLLAEIERKNGRLSGPPSEFPPDSFANFIGGSDVINEVKYLAYKASKSKCNVLIMGESGTGKSMLARDIHDLYHKDAPFVEVNCNAIAPSLFESELFGYVGGAFTGALASGRAGYFEHASGGTIFLDEIGDLPAEIQVKLLHVLQNKIIYRVGSSKAIPIDVKVLAATNKDLEREVADGRFRQDLYYRINVFPILIPPLRERKTDLYLLINSILEKVCVESGLPAKQLSGAALQAMLHYGWPGNVRELENVLERAVTICETNLIYPEQINISAPANSTPLTMKELLEEEEKRILSDSLKRNHGDKQLMMEELDLSRSVLYDKLKRYGINEKKGVATL